MYKIHIGLILQDEKLWTTHQIDYVQAITIQVICAHGFFYNLTVPNPPEVVNGHGTQSSMPDIPKPLIEEKVVKEKVIKEKAKEEVIKEKTKQKRKERKQKGKAKKAKKTAKLTHHLMPHSTASGTAIFDNRKF